jgi:flagellar hook assembly protein FlgD
VNGNSNQIPKTFALEQNYPNPFNPGTNIKFQLPKSEFVTVTIFDMLGKKVATLVNEQKEAGYYDIKFDGTNYASGMYFYKIEAGNFTDTKKMILIK